MWYTILVTLVVDFGGLLLVYILLRDRVRRATTSDSQIEQIRAEVSPELTGVGYIIGPRVGGYLFAGGVLSFFVLIPAIKLFGAGLTAPIFPATTLISTMSPMQVRANYVFYIGAGTSGRAGALPRRRASRPRQESAPPPAIDTS